MGAIRLRTDVLSGVGGQTHLSSCNDDMALAIGIVGIACATGSTGRRVARPFRRLSFFLVLGGGSALASYVIS